VYLISQAVVSCHAWQRVCTNKADTMTQWSISTRNTGAVKRVVIPLIPPIIALIIAPRVLAQRIDTAAMDSSSYTTCSLGRYSRVEAES
jgi:hypothetical protein